MTLMTKCQTIFDNHVKLLRKLKYTKTILILNIIPLQECFKHEILRELGYSSGFLIY